MELRGSLAVSLHSLIPDLDGPVCAAGDENPRVEVVPPDSVHRHAVSVIGLQQLLGVAFGALRKQLIEMPSFTGTTMPSDWASGTNQYTQGLSGPETSEAVEFPTPPLCN